MDVTLDVVKGNPKGKTVNVPEGSVSVGRAESNDVIIASTRISREHCEISNDGNRIVLRDKGSANGSFVNGQRVAEQVLRDGDEVQIGPLTFKVSIEGQPEGEPPKLDEGGPEPQLQPQPDTTEPPAPKAPGGGEEKDIFGALDRMAGEKGKKKPGQAGGDEDVLQISDEDLLDED